MFGDLKLTAYQIEAALPDYLARGSFSPLGDLLTYINDRGRGNLRFNDLELLPLSPDRQFRGVKKETASLPKKNLLALNVVQPEQAQGVQLLQASRPVICYTAYYVVRGRLHINQEAPDDDLLDDTRDFMAFSQAEIVPLRRVAVKAARQAPLLFLNQSYIQLYHIDR